jgi:hypothetical protein
MNWPEIDRLEGETMSAAEARKAARTARVEGPSRWQWLAGDIDLSGLLIRQFPA